jgi:putative redox protein
MQFLKLKFPNQEGKKLSARLDFPIDEKPVAYALFAHCFTCTKNYNAVVNISRALSGQGIAVLRFDFTGLGESEGDFADTNFSSSVGDLVAAARFLESKFEPPSLLVGHSLGGAAVIHAAAKIPSTAAVATIAAPAGLSGMIRFLRKRGNELEQKGEAEIVIAGRPFTVKEQLLHDLEGVGMDQAIRNLNRPLLIFHSRRDTVVDMEEAKQIFEKASHPKAFVSLEEADHLLSDRRDSLYVGTLIASWAGRYMKPAKGLAVSPSPEDNRVVVRTGKAGLQTEIMVRNHRMIADEPLHEGGSDTGPTPYDYLSAALGACTSMTLRMYADRKQWPLGEIVVRLKHEKTHAEDCRQCAKTAEGMDRIVREIEVTGPLTSEQRERLLKISERCPVHRTLTSQIHVESRLKEA